MLPYLTSCILFDVFAPNMEYTVAMIQQQMILSQPYTNTPLPLPTCAKVGPGQRAPRVVLSLDALVVVEVVQRNEVSQRPLPVGIRSDVDAVNYA